MKIRGQQIEGPGVEIVVIPRPNTEHGDIVFKAQAILDFDDFEKLCPLPKPPTMRKRGVEGLVHDIENPRYKQALTQHGNKRLAWMMITSLRATEDLEWETVDYSNSDTWENYREELKKAGFNEIEVGRLIRAVMIVNSLDETKLEEARNRFLAGIPEPPKESSSQSFVQQIMQSGKPANDSESVPQESNSSGKTAT